MSPRGLFVASHAAMILLGIAAARIYWETQRAAVESVIHMVASGPPEEAANLAYRFGSADHARTLLTDMPRMPERDITGWGNSMITEIRLAVIDGEHVGTPTATPHISAAVRACKALRNKQGCNADQMRRLATKIAKQRAL